jgi:hypothetical protein
VTHATVPRVPASHDVTAVVFPAPGGPVTTVSGLAAIRSSIRGRLMTHSFRQGAVIFESGT